MSTQTDEFRIAVRAVTAAIQAAIEINVKVSGQLADLASQNDGLRLRVRELEELLALERSKHDFVQVLPQLPADYDPDATDQVPILR